MELVVLTPEKEVYKGNVKSVKVPGTKGQFEILKGHAPIVSSLQEGIIRIVDEDGKTFKFSIEKGFVEVIKNEVALLLRGITEIES